MSTERPFWPSVATIRLARKREKTRVVLTLWLTCSIASIVWNRAVLPSRCGDNHTVCLGTRHSLLWLEQSVALCLVLELQIL